MRLDRGHSEDSTRSSVRRSTNGARNSKPNQKNGNSRLKKATAIGAIVLMFFASAAAKTYAENKNAEKEINIRVTQMDLNVSKDMFLKQQLHEAYKAFKKGYTNYDEAFTLLENQTETVAKTKSIDEIKDTIDETRDALWITGIEKPSEPHLLIKEAQIKEASKLLNARAQSQAKYKNNK